MKTTFSISLVTIVLACLLTPGPAFATDRTVTTLADSGTGSLRAAIAASSNNDSILFQPGLSGTITLTSGELEISTNLSIIGPVENVLTVSGNYSSRVFNISSNATVTISGLTISAGLNQGADGTADSYPQSVAGGGIINSGTLTLQNCTVSGNAAVAGNAGTFGYQSAGAAGGGIYSSGTLTLFNCEVLNNLAQGGTGASQYAGGEGASGGGGDGGGICSGGPIQLYNSTVAYNIALSGPALFGPMPGGSFAGGIDVGGGGTLQSSTIAYNDVIASPPGYPGSLMNLGGGIYGWTAPVTITSCTIYGNYAPEDGGGIWDQWLPSATVGITMGNTIVSGNTSDQDDEYANLGAEVVDLGFNFIGGSPQLGPLQNNGGPTLTMAPSPASPVIDQGYSFNLNTDQRDYPRPVIYYPYRSLPGGGDGSDIGAFELAKPRLSIILFPPHRLLVGWNENQPMAGGQAPAPFYGVQAAFPGSPVYPNNPVAWTNFSGFVRPIGNQYVALDAIGSSPVLYELSSGVTSRFIPGPTTLFASNITTTSATLYATDIPVGSNTLYWFQFGTDTNYTNGVTVTNGLATSTNPASLSCSIAGLSAGTLYHFQVVVTDDWGAQYGGDTNFTTPSPPAAVTSAATSVTSVNAQLNGTINPNFGDTTWWFEYGYDTNYSIANTATAVVSASNTNAVPVNILAGGLYDLTLYHFQLVASNIAGVSYGGDQQFTTPGLPPTVTTLAASSITATTATLNGTVNGNGSLIAGYFQYSQDMSYSNNTSGSQFYNTGNYNSPVAFSTAISNLTPNTTYNYRIIAFGASEAFGANTNFTTAAELPTAVTDGATNLVLVSGSTYSATFIGTVNPNGSDTKVWFLYGTPPGQGALSFTTPVYDIGSGTAPVNYSYTVSNLNQQAASMWGFSIMASNSVGVTNGAILSVNLP